MNKKDLTTQTEEILIRYGIRPKKKFGQCFLVDEKIIELIVKEIAPKEDDIILEIGAGIGTLTTRLAPYVRRMMVVELDPIFIKVLKECFSYLNVDIIHGDILKVNIRKLLSFCGLDHCKVKVVANLPYYITTDVLFWLIKHKDVLSDVVCMVQKEVAARILAQPNSKAYGLLSIIIGYHAAKIELIAHVSASSFLPKPKVDSSIIKLRFYNPPSIKVIDESLFFKIIRLAFLHRRKQILNTLSQALSMDKYKVKALLKELNIKDNLRPEVLSLEDFAKISNLASNYRTKETK